MSITLELPENLEQQVAREAQRTGATVEQVALNWLEEAALKKLILDPNISTHLYTPYGNEDGAAALFAALKAAEAHDSE